MPRRLLLVVVLTLSLVPVLRVPDACAIEEPDRLWTVGANAFADKLYPTARRLLEQLVQKYPDDPRAGEAWLMLGKARLAQEDLPQALLAFQRALAFPKRPGRPQEAKFWEAETLFRLKRYAEAERAYDGVLREDAASPLAPDALYGRAWAQLEQKRPEAAVTSFHELLDVPVWVDSPLIPQATFALARTLVDLKRFDEAVPLLVGFTSKYPAHKQAADAQYLLGWTRLAVGKTAQGIADLRAFVRAHPSHELADTARRRITEAVQKLGDRTELSTEYRTLMEGKASAEGLYAAGTIAGQLGDGREQEAAWRRLLREFSDDPLARRAGLALAQAAFKQEQYADAVTLAAPATKSEEMQAEAWLLTGEAQLKLKKAAEAVKAFKAVSAIPGVDRGLRLRALAGSAVASEEEQHWGDALRLYEEVATDAPDEALRQWARESVLALGKTRLAQSDLDIALDAFRRARKLVPPPGRSQEARFWEAETLFRLKRYPEARTAYEAVVRADPASPVAPDAVYGLAWLELEQKRLEPAIRGFRQFVEKWPDHALAGDATFALAQTLVDVKRFDEALPVLAQFITRYPNHERAGDGQYLLGWTALMTGKTRDGIKALRAFVVSSPTHPLVPVARRRVTEAVERFGDKAELATEYQALTADTPPTPEGLYEAGVIAGRLNQPQDQEAAWERLRREFPGQALAQRAALELAQAAYKREQYADAIELAKAAVPSDEMAADANLLIGEAQLKLKDHGAALAAFGAVTALPSVDRAVRVRALAGSAVAQEEQQHWADALTLYEEVASDSSDTTLRQWAREAALALGKARLAQGDLATALDAFQRARKLVPAPGRSQEARFWEAETLFRLKRYPAARAAYEAVVRADPGSPVAPEAMYGLGWLELEQKSLAPAVQYFGQFLQKWPDHALAADATFIMARTLVDLKRYDEAVPPLATFTRKYPTHEHIADARYLLGWTELAMGKPADGIKDLRTFVAAYPAHELVAGAKRRITEAVQRLGDKGEMATEYRALMADSAATADSLYDAVAIAGQLGEAKEQEAAWALLRQKFPDHPLAQRAALELAHAAYRQEQYAEALELAKAATRGEEIKAEALLQMGEAALKLHQHADALRAFQAVTAMPGVDAALKFRALAGSALAQEEQQRWPDALKLYEQVAADSPDATLKQWAQERVAAIKAQQKRLLQRAALDHASALFTARKFGEAVAQARAVTQSDDVETRVEAFLLIGEAELTQKRPAPALEAFEAATKVEGIDAGARDRALAGSGRALEAQQQLAEALARYSAIAADGADEALARWAQERMTAVKAQQKRLAQRALEQASAAFKRKQYEETLAQAHEAARSEDPALRAEGLLLVGQAQLRLKRYPAALEAFEAVAAVPGVDPSAQFRALQGGGTAYEEQQQWDEALKRYEEIANGRFDAQQKRWARERAAAVKARQAAPARKPIEKTATKS